MSNQKNNPPVDRQARETERRPLPFVVEFVKFAAGFAAIVAIALLTLHIASAAM